MSISLTASTSAHGYLRKLNLVCLGLLAVYLSTGNLLKLIPGDLFKENLLITEFLLHATCFVRFCFVRKMNHSWSALFFISVVILGSGIFGTILHGFDLPSFIYSIRLVLIALTGSVLGVALFETFKLNIRAFYVYFSTIYLVQIFLGFLIYLLFKQSKDLWTFLSLLGIVIRGDPHEGRFVSTYFDPNFFAAIGCIPFLILIRLYVLRPSLKGIIPILVVTGSILLTWSRSGIATLFLLSFGAFFISIKSRKIYRIHSVLLKVVCFLPVILILLFYPILEDVNLFICRFANLGTDYSALGRITSFEFGWNIFLNNPLFGTGYNYLCYLMRDGRMLSSVDSSILSTLICFGVTFTFIFMVCFLLWVVHFWKSALFVRKINPELYLFSRWLILYLLIVFVFTSQMNNLLYYPFWLLPMTSIFVYLSLSISQSKRS